MLSPGIVLLILRHLEKIQGEVRSSIFASRERVVAALGFGPAAWKVACRDAFIGWEPAVREANLPGVVNNDRFVILPWVRVPHLASFLLGHCLRRLRRDWMAHYATPIVLAETFVERERFAGTCYRAANWRPRTRP